MIIKLHKVTKYIGFNHDEMNRRKCLLIWRSLTVFLIGWINSLCQHKNDSPIPNIFITILTQKLASSQVCIKLWNVRTQKDNFFLHFIKKYASYIIPSYIIYMYSVKKGNIHRHTNNLRHRYLNVQYVQNKDVIQHGLSSSIHSTMRLILFYLPPPPTDKKSEPMF